MDGAHCDESCQTRLQRGPDHFVPGPTAAIEPRGTLLELFEEVGREVSPLLIGHFVVAIVRPRCRSHTPDTLASICVPFCRGTPGRP
jgi:hypothetical protein